MYGGGDGRRRGRSASPPQDRFRRSPPPPQKRYRRDDDYDGHDRYPGSGDRGGGRGYRGRGGYGGRGRGGYGRPPYDDRYDDRGPPRRRDTPLTFREFMQELPNDITPEAANEEYRAYLANWWGDAIKAEFEERKHDPALRKRFDPREIAKVFEQRNELARTSAQAFADDLAADAVTEDGQTPPGPAGFGPPADSSEAMQQDSTAPPQTAPPLVWQAQQVAADLALAKQLAQQVDREKGVTTNSLAPPPAQPPAGEGGAEQTGGEQSGAEAEQPADMDAELSYEEQLAKLDQLLAYLWRVHGIDYYGGREYFDPEEPGRTAARRTLRGERPEQVEGGEGMAAAGAEGEAGTVGAESAGNGTAQGAVDAEGEGEEGGNAGGKERAGSVAAAVTSPRAAAAAAADKPPSAAEAAAKEYEHRVTGFWKYRIEHGDALEAPLQRKRIEEGIEAFIEEQIIKHDDNKWGNKLSSKLFMGRDFVVKHIRNKHSHVLDAERERLQDMVYWENFRAFKQEEQRRQQEEQEAVMAGWGAGSEGTGGRGGMRGGMRGGRGGRGFGGGLLDGGGIIMADPSMVMGAPVFVPGAAAPVIVPMDMVMPLGMAGPMGGRGGRGTLRGVMRGGRSVRGGMLGGPGAKLDAGGGVREYFDLDAPQNNRAVLDYGDL